MDLKTEYGTVSQGITITLASLASASYRESAALDNTSNKFLDVLIYLAIALQAGSPTGEKALKVFFYASEDGTNYTNNATGSNAAITPPSPSNLLGPFIIQAPSSGALTWKAVFPIAQFFGGIMPPKWGIVIQNATGVTLSATEGDHTKEYRGIYSTVA